MNLHGFEKHVLSDINKWSSLGKRWEQAEALADYVQPIKIIILSTELFSVLTQSGWSFSLCIA